MRLGRRNDLPQPVATRLAIEVYSLSKSRAPTLTSGPRPAPPPQHFPAVAVVGLATMYICSRSVSRFISTPTQGRLTEHLPDPGP